MRAFISALFLSLTACACSYFSFESNVDPGNFVSYFEISRVKIYETKEIAELNYEDIGTVEGVSCQFGEDDPYPTQGEARADARTAALKKGANGIVYTTCIELENTPACVRSVSCYARALIVREENP